MEPNLCHYTQFGAQIGNTLMQGTVWDIIKFLEIRSWIANLD